MSIKLDNISLAFEDKVIFDGFSHEFSHRGVVCLMAPSGRGKTTLLRLLCGLQKPDGGKVSCPKASVMFQEDRLFPWLTAGQNIEAVAGSREKAERYLSLVELSEEYDSLPSSLSGGMTRRVALARALAYDSEVLLLDEPLKGLDEALRDRVRELICLEGQKRLVVMVTHDESDPEALSAEILKI